MEEKDFNVYCRIESIHMVDFRNIEETKITFENGNVEDFVGENGRSSVTGIYGPNGSGKTTVLLAVELLRNALSGKMIYRDNWIVKAGKEKAHLDFSIIAYSEEKGVSTYNIVYSFDLFNCKTVSYIDADGNKCLRDSTGIKNETIKYGGKDYKAGLVRQKVLISTEDLYTNKGKRYFGAQIGTKIKDKAKCASSDKFYDSIVKYKEDEELLAKCKSESIEKAKSFIFNNVLYNYLTEKFEGNDYVVYRALKFFANNIAIVNDSNRGIFFEDEFKVLNVYEENDEVVNKTERLAFGKKVPSIVGQVKDKEDLQKQINRINGLLKNIIDDFEIAIEFKDKLVDDKSMEVYSLYSIRNGNIKIPLTQESLGVKKIISFVMGLWAVANNKGFTLAVDEIESGIYDILLCNILKSIQDKGKGQLIFTAHNLSPLDSSKTRKGLDYKCIRFATPNAIDKFIKIPIKGNNNLRDKYIDLVLNNQKDKEKLDPRLKELYMGEPKTDSLFE